MRVTSRQFGVFLLCAAFGAGISAEAQTPRKRPAVKKPGTVATTSVKPTAAPVVQEAGPDKARFDEAVAAPAPAAKAELLVKFLADFPKSGLRARAQESLAGARAALADEAIAAGSTEQAVKLFRLAIDEAPKPHSDRLFNEIILTIPANLYWRGARAEGYEIARAIEAHVANDAKRLAALGTFYLSVEDGAEAKRLAEAAIKLDANGSAGYQTLGMAHRLNFELEESEKAFAKALELDANSGTAKRMLAEMKRALGRSGEAATLYQELLAKDENDNAARTGYVLALFDSGKRADAEAELARALEKTPGNVFLLAGAGYWYAANNDGAKAAELAQQAIAREPRFIWSHIALARGLMAQGKPVDAEQALVAARKYGNFPTLRYEIAAARFSAGFYRDAAEELRSAFTADADGIRSKLGGRVDRSGKSFTELVSYERRASIFTPAAADSAEAAEQMRALLEFDQAMSAEKPNEAAALAAAERFTGGSDEMATFRRLYASRALNEKQIAPEKALEYARSAIAKVDTALNVANPASAVMASELYDARATAFSNNDFLLIPEVPRQTLSAILRGRIEESTGVALLQSGNPAEANVRFRRALSVLPKDSAWWRSATWNLGRALEAEGKDQEALRAYIASYKTDRPNVGRYLAINALYKKVNGGSEGLEAEIGPNPIDSTLASSQPAAAPEPSPAAARPTETVVEKPVVTRPLPSTLPVADRNASPIETKANETATPETKAPVETAVETKTAAPKEGEPRPAEEKPVEVKKSDESSAEVKTAPVETKPVSEAPAETKPVEKSVEEKKDARVEAAPEPKPVEEKPVEEKKEPESSAPSDEKPAEVKKEPATEPTDRPAEVPRPIAEEPKSETKEPRAEQPPSGSSKEPKPAGGSYRVFVNDKPVGSKPTDSPGSYPISQPPPQVSVDKLPGPVTNFSNRKQETRKQEEERAKPDPEPSTSQEPGPAERPRFSIVKTDLTAPKPAEVKPPARTTAKSARPTDAGGSKPDPSRSLFDPVVIKVPGAGGQSLNKEAAGYERGIAAETDPGRRVRRCSIGVSQEEISIGGEDGTVALLVSVDGGVDITAVRGISTSEEIEVLREPRIAGIDDRIVYLLRSATGRSGLYQVSFTAPCGRKTVNVRVR